MPGQAKILTPKEMDLVSKVLDSSRDKLLFALGIYTGMRISEIIALRRDQIFTTDGGIRYQITGKRLKKNNTVYSDIPVHPKLRQLLKSYPQDPTGSEWLFPSTESTTGHLSRARAHEILAGAFRALKLQGASTHSMRRSCLTYLSRAGIP